MSCDALTVYALQQLEEKFMSLLTQLNVELNDAIDAAEDRIETRLAELEDHIDERVLTDEEIKGQEEIRDRINGIIPSAEDEEVVDVESTNT